MEDKCFKEGCEEEASFLCKCISPHVKTCESHFFDHMTSNASRSHNPIVLKIRVDSNDSKEVIEILESHKNNIYNNIKKLAEVTKELHLCIEAEFVRQSNTLRGRLNEIQNLIEKLSDLRQFRNDENNTSLYKLFSGDNAERHNYLEEYQELSNALDLSNFKKSCERIFAEIDRLNYSLAPEEDKDSEFYEFSDSSNALITYNLLTMQKKERFLEGEFLGSKVKCVLPDGRLFCYRELRSQIFIFDPSNNNISYVEPLRSFKLSQDIPFLVDDCVIHFIFTVNVHRTIQRDTYCYDSDYDYDYYTSTEIRYIQFDLKKMSWNKHHQKTLNLEGFISERASKHSARSVSFVKFQDDIYATATYSSYVYLYSRQRNRFIEIFKLDNSDIDSMLLFVHKDKLYLLQKKDKLKFTNLSVMEPHSKRFIKLHKFDHKINLNPYLQNSTRGEGLRAVSRSTIENLNLDPYCIRSIGDFVYLCYYGQSPAKINLEKYQVEFIDISKFNLIDGEFTPIKNLLTQQIRRASKDSSTQTIIEVRGSHSQTNTQAISSPCSLI